MAALSAIRTDARLRANDQNSRIVSDAQALILINAALEEWVNRTEEVRQENAFALTAKQILYDAPADMIRLLLATYMQTGWNPLSVLSAHEAQQEGAYDLYHGSGLPRLIAVEGKNAAYKFRLFPPPASSGATTTLNGAVASSSSTSITVASTTGLHSPGGWVIVDSEKIMYQNVSSTQLLLCVRGAGNTTAATHSDLATVTQLDLHTVYTRRPAALSADADVPEIDARWHKYLVSYIVAEILKLDDRDPSWFSNDWEAGIKEARREIRKAQGASPSYFLSGGY